MSYRGDIRLGETIDVKFATVSTTGAPTTLAGSPVISAYVGNGTTELTAGITLSVDFDGRTGLHNVRVVASGGNGYTAPTNVDLVITTGTVGGTSVVGYVIGSFSIENRSAVMPTTAARTLDVSAGGEAGVDWANVGSPTTAQNLSGTNIKTDQVVASVSGAVGSVTGAVGSVTGAVGSVSGNIGGNVVGSVASVTGLTASDVGAIKAKTDPLTFTVSNVLDANISAINGSATGVNKLSAHVKGVLMAIIGAGSTTTAVVLNSGTGIDGGAPSATNDFYNGRVIVFTSGALAGQATDITDYDGTTKTLTVTALTSGPSAADIGVIV